MNFISIGKDNKSLVIVKQIVAVMTNGKTRFNIVLSGADPITLSYDTEAERDGALETVRRIIEETK
jgi:hypothetical protein